MRIVKTRYKVLFLLVSALVLGFIVGGLQAAGLETATGWANVVGVPVIVIAAVRMFRVREEDVARPRPLWRTTGRPTAGFFIGGLNALSVAAGVWGLVYAAGRDDAAARAAADGTGLTIVSLVVDGLFAVWYLNSAFRLARHAPEPAWTREA